MRVLLTAGATREPLDPVRFISNRSSGRMGLALRQALVNRKAEILFIHGHIEQKPPKAALAVSTAARMYDAVLDALDSFKPDIYIGCAAVADFIPEAVPQKIKKQSIGARLSVGLSPAPDILAAVAASEKCAVVVGFAAETENLVANARDKLYSKKADMVIANFACEAMERTVSRATILTRHSEEVLARAKKDDLAAIMVDRIFQVYEQKITAENS